MDTQSYQLLIDKALKLLSYRPRSKSEIVNKLKPISVKNGISEKIFDQTISDLEKRNLINDEEFAQWWVDQRAEFRHKGKRLLKIELLQKGIENGIIEKVRFLIIFFLWV